MPKSKKKAKHGNSKLPPKTETFLINSEEESNIDNVSVISLQSDSKYGSENDPYNDSEAEDLMPFDDFEEKLKEAVDGINQKSTKARMICLQAITKALRSRYLYDFLSDRKVTVVDLLEKCLKKGKTEEQGYAAILSCLVCIHLGASNETELLFADLRSLLLTVIADKTASPLARAKCATALGLHYFIAGEGFETTAAMDALCIIFSGSFLKGNGAIPNVNPETSILHSSALLSWSLLLTIMSTPFVLDLTEKHLKRLPELLESSDVELRIAAGEAIAILYELAREYDENFVGENVEELCAKLQQLATDSQKFRAKKDRRQQRSSFRDILHTVEDREPPDVRVRFGREILGVDSWCRKRQYDAFCQILGSGMNLHLTENDLLRDIFELGTPLCNSGLSPKISKFERHFANVAACKLRTKTRGRLRDKRADVVG